jgi:uncharacterized damage-inducible protein DinB
MNIVDYIQKEYAALRRQINAVTADLTDEQLNWTAPGKANKIGVTLLHAIESEDMFVHKILQGKPTLWETQGWGAQIGISNPPGHGGWEEASQATLALSQLMAFEEAVCEETSAYLAILSPEELDRKVLMFNGERQVADVLVLVANHTLGHMGEIAALKGVHGVKGLPF